MTLDRGALGHEVLQRRVDDEQPRPGVLEDVADLVRHQSRVDRDEHGTCPGHAVVRLQQLVAVRREERDPVAFLDPALLERRRQPARALTKLRPGQPFVTVDDGGAIGERGRRAFEERERGHCREVNRGRDAVPYNRHGDHRNRVRGPALERGQTARITLNRPEKRNALSLELMEQLIRALESAAADPDTRTIVLAGAGPVFSAGHDLSEMVGRDLAFYEQLFDTCTVLMETIHRVPQPVIARVHGVATAAGCQLVAACDLAVAADTARFATPGVKIGLFCSTPMVPLSRAIGRKRALEMLLTGEMVDAAKARDWGLVNLVVAEDELDDAVAGLAEKVAGSSPLTVAIGKEAFYAQIDLDEHGAYDLTKSVMAANSLAGDAQEGIGAFLEKRPPEWTGT